MSNQPNTADRFRDLELTLANGVVGANVEIDSADPVNYREAIGHPDRMTGRVIDAKLFWPVEHVDPKPAALCAAVILVPGSLGVAPSHLGHAATLTSLGIAVLVIDPFGARSVTSTVANQTQFSFAASAWDVLAALRSLAATPGIDPDRIGAQGHSRGGSAVLTAAARRLAVPVLGDSFGLAAVYAAYPWSGQQFVDPDIGETAVRAIIGEADDWCSPQQVQGHVHAMALRGGDATFRLVPGAGHSFDRSTAVEDVADASVSPNAPTTYIADDGSMIHPSTGQADPTLVDRDVMRWAVKAGYGRKGATIGSRPGQAELFVDDMVTFWTTKL